MGQVGDLSRTGAGFSMASFDGRDSGGSTHFDDVPVGDPVTALFRRRPPAYTAEDMAHPGPAG
ncbi:hypothetical protein Ait01nite_079700 [Actinoplanes italicus]|nr:hypothetical protein Ait01nite_079700 [Actinoplanes italicus]